MAQRMTEEQRAMVEENMPLIGWYLQRTSLNIRRDEREDAYQQASLGLCVAAMNYEPERGTAFTTYAMFYIAGHVRHWARDRAKREAQCTARLEDEAPGCEEGVLIRDQVADDKAWPNTGNRMVIMEAIGKIDRQERRVMKLALRGYTQKEIARRCRMTQPTVHRRLLRARDAIRARLV